MTQKTNYFKLGLFVILAFALTAAMLIAFGAGQFLKTETLAETYFNESVQGLNVGSEVKYKGVKIGAVKSITTPTKVYDVASNYVLVTFSLSEDCYVGQTGKNPRERMKKAVDDGLSIFLSFNGLTGSAYLETDYKDKEPDALEIPWTPKKSLCTVPAQQYQTGIRCNHPGHGNPGLHGFQRDETGFFSSS